MQNKKSSGLKYKGRKRKNNPEKKSGSVRYGEPVGFGPDRAAELQIKRGGFRM